MAVQPPAPPVEEEQGEDEEDEQEEARAEDANEAAHEAGNEAQAGQAAADSCFVSVLELESRRSSPQGKYGPWLPQPLTSRDSVDCGSITPQKLPSKYRELFMRWPESSEETVLRVEIIKFLPAKAGAPNTQWAKVKVHTRVSAGSP